MGKHDMQETVFAWQPMPDEYYKARIRTLEKENLRLKEALEKKEVSIGAYELVIDHQEEVHNGVVAELDQLIDEKSEEIEVLKGRIKMLEAAIVKGALREVIA